MEPILAPGRLPGNKALPFIRFAGQICVALLLCTPSLAFTPRPHVVHFHKNDYRGENQNWSVDIGPDGLAYIGNNSGLLTFDGANWEAHSRSDFSVIRSVAMGEDGKLYTGSYEEFGYWIRDITGRLWYSSLSDSLEPSLLHNDEIWRIIPFEGKVYFQSFSKIYVYDGRKTEIIWPPSSLVLLQKAGNRLFVHANDAGLYELTGSRFRFIEGSGFLANDEIKVVLPFPDNRILVGALESGLFIYDGNGFVPWSVPASEEIRNAEINIGILLDGKFFIGTIAGGLYILNKEGRLLHHLHTGNHLQNNTVLALKPDQSGNLWVCLDKGIDYVQLGNQLDLYLDRTGRLGSVYAAASSGDELYIGTNHGLFRFGPDPAAGPGEPVMLPGSNGQVWNLGWFDGELLMGHTRGTFRVMENNRLEPVSEVNGGYCLKKFTHRDRDYLLQSTYSHLVLYRKTNGRWTFSHRLTGLLEPLSWFETDHLDYIWASHNNRGVYRIRLADDLKSVVSARFFDKGKGLANDWNVGICKVNNRVIFLTGEEIQTYDDLNDTIVAYGYLNQQLGDFSKSTRAVPAGENRYWFLSGQQAGLWTIDETGSNLLFRYQAGLQNIYFVPSHSRIEQISDSLFLFCLDEGFAILPESRIERRDSSATPLLRRIHARDDKNRELYLSLSPSGEPVRLPNSFHNLQFRFSTAGLHLHHRYRYRLKGFSESWTDWSANSVVNFNRLHQGHYNFQFQSVDINGNESPVVKYPFSIRPPWFFSRLAVAVYILLAVAGILLLRIAFLRRLRMHAGRLEKMEVEKRKQEQILSEQRYMRLKNDSLEKEIQFKNRQLTNYTYNIIHRNKTLIKIKEELLKLRSEDMHADRPGKYTRMLKLVDRNLSTEDDWKIFESHFDEAHQDFFKRLIQTYPDLTPSDLRLSAYLRLNLSSKEIAPLLNISLRGVEIRRYRLRKRLKLNTDENLVEFILRF